MLDYVRLGTDNQSIHACAIGFRVGDNMEKRIQIIEDSYAFNATDAATGNFVARVFPIWSTPYTCISAYIPPARTGWLWQPYKLHDVCCYVNAAAGNTRQGWSVNLEKILPDGQGYQIGEPQILGAFRPRAYWRVEEILDCPFVILLRVGGVVDTDVLHTRALYSERGILRV